jgi:hypothetical protein
MVLSWLNMSLQDKMAIKRLFLIGIIKNLRFALPTMKICLLLIPCLLQICSVQPDAVSHLTCLNLSHSTVVLGKNRQKHHFEPHHRWSSRKTCSIPIRSGHFCGDRQQQTFLRGNHRGQTMDSYRRHLCL